jgi:hypothetical protein
MSRFQRFFEKAGLIEGTEEAQVGAPDAAVMVASKPVGIAPTLSAYSDLTVPEGTELAVVYNDAGIGQTTFSIEKLTKLVDGLSQLDPETKKTAVRAMDATDDSWKIETVVEDGRAKVAALNSYVNDVEALGGEINAEVLRRIDAAQAKKKTTVDEIEVQIAGLEKQREAAISDAATEAARLRQEGLAAGEAAEREKRRVLATVKVYETLINLFDQTAAETSNPHNQTGA